jgi:hypothetical protein
MFRLYQPEPVLVRLYFSGFFASGCFCETKRGSSRDYLHLSRHRTIPKYICIQHTELYTPQKDFTSTEIERISSIQDIVYIHLPISRFLLNDICIACRAYTVCHTALSTLTIISLRDCQKLNCIKFDRIGFF